MYDVTAEEHINVLDFGVGSQTRTVRHTYTVETIYRVTGYRVALWGNPEIE